MDVIVSGKHLEITEPIRAYAMEKAGRLPRYFDRVIQVEIVLDKSDSRHHEVEFIVHIPNHDHIVATGKHEDLYACIDETVSKAERQLHDHKEKTKNHKH